MEWKFTALGRLFKHKIYKIKSHFEKCVLFNYQVFKTGLPSKIVLYKWNFLRLVSISRGLWTHSYSPYLESKVPF